ncbi:MAG TPA: GNAT family N-acetyltransferase [Pseudonocardiaceae bacterium]|nr:GNAT family N-acetyltransferase [Pseudonocardiaceae bacterium]
MNFRTAGPADAPSVAALHADSWRRHYRGAYADSFLDYAADDYLTGLWTERLTTPKAPACTIVAEHDGQLVGLAHTVFDADPTWGALLDNLHVRSVRKRQGIGTRLLAMTGVALRRRSPSSGLYLWVLEQNTAAQAFYAAQGGERVDRDEVPPPGGNPDWLNGKPGCFRYAWRDPARLGGQTRTAMPG